MRRLRTLPLIAVWLAGCTHVKAVVPVPKAATPRPTGAAENREKIKTAPARVRQPETNHASSEPLNQQEKAAFARNAAAKLDQKQPRAPAESDRTSKPIRPMDYGPFLAASYVKSNEVSLKQKNMSTEQLPSDSNKLANKGIAIRLGVGDKATVCFDTGLLRMAAGWTGGFVNFTDTHLIAQKGKGLPAPAGALRFETAPVPGWSLDGRFEDPRPRPYGPLPATYARYTGLYRHGRQVVLAYTVGKREILELPGVVSANGRVAFTRTFRINRSNTPLYLLVADVAGAELERKVSDNTIFLQTESAVMSATVLGSRIRAQWRVTDGRVALRLPPFRRPITFTVLLWNGNSNGPANNQRLILKSLTAAAAGKIVDPATLILGGPGIWTQPIVTKGKVADGGGAYVVDTVALPQNNPWGSWIRPGGIDFFSDGRAAICTWNGDVWVSSVLDASLQHVTWRRFASGLYQPLGITVYKNSVYVNGRDQITRLHDLNGDGEADFYENFNNTALTVRNYHAFAFDLKVDARGFFYYSRNGHRVASELPDHGSVIRVAPDGLSHEVFAYGFRAPNGISLSPDGEITTGDNEGHWTPACKINLVRRGGFYGYSRHMPPGHKDSGKFDQPICWLPQNVDNSSGGQFWVTSRRWGPFTGRLLHTSYGEASLFLVMKENVRGQTQGGVVRFPLSFDSGIMRGAFGPHDGQLYVCGLKGWQTKGPKPGALQRVRFTGKPVHLPTALKVTRDGVKISFTCALDRASATDPDNYAVEHWNYRRSKKYGSKHYSVKDPKKQGHDKVAVTRATLLPDRLTVRLKLSGIRPVMQMMIKYRIQSADGAELSQEIYNTIHRLGTN